MHAINNLTALFFYIFNTIWIMFLLSFANKNMTCKPQQNCCESLWAFSEWIPVLNESSDSMIQRLINRESRLPNESVFWTNRVNQWCKDSFIDKAVYWMNQPFERIEWINDSKIPS